MDPVSPNGSQDGTTISGFGDQHLAVAGLQWIHLDEVARRKGEAFPSGLYFRDGYATIGFPRIPHIAIS